MSLRRVVLALAVLCLMAGVASAQFSQAQQVTCTVSSSSQPSLRAESTHELVGDVILQCVAVITGAQIPNGQVPAVDLTVNYGTAITSRQNAIGNPAVTYSDVALVLDDPSSNIVTPLATGYGPAAALASCLTITAAGSSAPACPTYDTPTTGLGAGNVTPANGGYYVLSATQNESSSPAKNVYQGVITGGGQAVTFYGVPVATPVSAGIYRKFRVVNVRVAPGSSTISATVSTSGPNGGAAGVMLLSNTSATVGAGKTAFGYSTSNVGGVASVPTIVSQCLQPNAVTNVGIPVGGYSPNVALLSFSENFANAAKPIGSIVVPALGSTVYGTYNTESEIILPAMAQATNNANNGLNAATPGAADAGTRFKAVFAGLPYTKAVASTTIYVSFGNVTNFTTDAGGGNNGSAVLTEGVGNAAAGVASAEFNQYLAASGNNGLYNQALPYAQIAPLTIASNGTATAVWEVTGNAAGKSPTFTFAVYIAYSSSTNVPALGNATVTLSAAPVQPATQPNPANAVQIPSFTTTPLGPQGVLNVVPCQTALLFPFVTTAKVTTTQHWETGIAISNTGSDPWNTAPTPTAAQLANMTCTISFFGAGAATGSSTFTPPSVTGPPVGPGSNWAFVASDPLATGTGPNVGFSGYAFAVCNFNLAHGFAFVEDNSPAGNAMGYLALVVNSQTARPNAPGGEGLLQ